VIRVRREPHGDDQSGDLTGIRSVKEGTMSSVVVSVSRRSRRVRPAALVFSVLALVIAAPAAVAETLHLGVREITLEVPDDWSVAKHANIHRIYSVSPGEQASLDAERLKEIVQISAHTYQAPDHGAALQRLREIAAESESPASFIEIGGWPALHRERLGARPQPGADAPAETEEVLKITTAVVVDDLLVRLEAWLSPDAPAELVASVEAVGASLRTSALPDPAQTDRDIQDLRAEPNKGLSLLILPEPGQELALSAVGEGAAAAPDLATTAGLAPAAGSTVRVTNQVWNDSELEIAVSDDGQNIVIGSNNGFFFSSDGGDTWNNSANVGANDPSVAWGQTSGPLGLGTFYAANIAGNTTGFWTSIDGGANFVGPTAAYTCGQGGDPPCNFPDQEHIAADRFNVTAGGDQVYSTWRHLDGNWGIVCSVDGGTTWSTLGNFFPGDLPKITVGQDGFVYVVYHPDDDDSIRLSKFASCETSQNPAMTQVFDVLVNANSTAVACPVPGLDRCNFRNSLASPTVAVDDTDANHIYVAYASNSVNTSAVPPGAIWWPGCNNQNICNEDIIVQDSLDGGATWDAAFTPDGSCVGGFCTNNPLAACATNADCLGDPRRAVVRISSGVTARRFMPWACAAGGEVFVSWYDRRAASPGGTTVSNNSLTDFYSGSAFLDAVGNLAKASEMQTNEADSTDAQCESGAATGTAASWRLCCNAAGNLIGAVDQQADSESCSLQPQLGGLCCVPGEINAFGRCLNPTAASTQVACDFNPDTCGAGETCAIARGLPKYGDYNGSACAAGRFFMTWASATSPGTLNPASTDIDAFFTSDLVCCEPEIQIPNPVDFGTVCEDATAALDVCNTGVEDLVVGSITSSDVEFAVTDPVGGFPVTISADFCFPFQVTFDTGNGSQAGTLTVNSNDPADPALDVSVSGTVGAPDFNLAIANSGEFGGVCIGEHADLDLTLFNQGACNLTIDSITSSDAQFVLPAATLFPLVLSPDAQFTLPVRFEPTSLGEQNATITSLGRRVPGRHPRDGEYGLRRRVRRGSGGRDGVGLQRGSVQPAGDLRLRGLSGFHADQQPLPGRREPRLLHRSRGGLHADLGGPEELHAHDQQRRSRHPGDDARPHREHAVWFDRRASGPGLPPDRGAERRRLRVGAALPRLEHRPLQPRHYESLDHGQRGRVLALWPAVVPDHPRARRLGRLGRSEHGVRAEHHRSGQRGSGIGDLRERPGDRCHGDCRPGSLRRGGVHRGPGAGDPQRDTTSGGQEHPAPSHQREPQQESAGYGGQRAESHAAVDDAEPAVRSLPVPPGIRHGAEPGSAAAGLVRGHGPDPDRWQDDEEDRRI
jgi:hypothetical protein